MKPPVDVGPEHQAAGQGRLVPGYWHPPNGGKKISSDERLVVDVTPGVSDHGRFVYMPGGTYILPVLDKGVKPSLRMPKQDASPPGPQAQRVAV
jgi:hypothetical protein